METIAAISTPPAAGGIAMIRISGAESLEIADRVFKAYHGGKVTEMRGYSCAYGQICENGERLDDVVLTVFRAPHSYTGEDVVEITCHGGIYLTKRILRLVFASGARTAAPGEFTKRAFLNGKISLTQAEAVMELISAEGDFALKQANLAKQGYIDKQIQPIYERLIEFISAMTYWMDDAEECPPELEYNYLIQQISEIIQKLQALADHHENGRVLMDGIRTVILGKPNAGKSSVMNWLCGTNRSIVTNIAGTTRDVISERVKIDEFTLILSDTAGIRETDNEIESIGIQQAYQMLDTSDFVLYVVDATVGITPEDEETLRQCGSAKVLILWNKTDLSDQKPNGLPYPVLECTAINETTFQGIAAELRKLFVNISSMQTVTVNERQYSAIFRQALSPLKNAVSLIESEMPLDIVAVQLEESAKFLQEIEGEHVSEDVIDTVFSRFCVGK